MTMRTLGRAGAMVAVLATAAPAAATPYSNMCAATLVPWGPYNDAQINVQWAAINDAAYLGQLYDNYLEVMTVTFRVPSAYPYQCFQYTAPYTGQHTFVNPGYAYSMAALNGSRGVVHDIHSHPEWWSPAGFSEEDLDELPISVPYGVLIEDGGRCIRWWYNETGYQTYQGQCR